MRRFAFELLYLVILGLLIGGSELARRGLPENVEDVVEAVIAEVIAVPPKPEGAQAGEGEGEGHVYTDEGCRKHRGDYREACFHALALQRSERDPEGGLAACQEIETERLHWECTADVAELHSVVDPDRSAGICTTIPRRKWRDQCSFGIALAWSTKDYDFSRAKCEDAGQFKNFCRHDVNGEIAQIDPENAWRWCEETRHTDLQEKGCYHGLGKYLGRTDPPKAAEICRRLVDRRAILPQNCFHGMGWALAETDVEQALVQCQSAAIPDSCRMGVSAYAKRFSVERCIEICEGVQDSGLRAKCLAFARR